MDEGHPARVKLGFRTTLPDTSIVLEVRLCIHRCARLALILHQQLWQRRGQQANLACHHAAPMVCMRFSGTAPVRACCHAPEQTLDVS